MEINKILKYLKNKPKKLPYSRVNNPPLSGEEIKLFLPNAHICLSRNLSTIPYDDKPIVILHGYSGSNHWVSINNGRREWFDSYGDEPPYDLGLGGLKKFNGKWQKNGVDCGKYVILRCLNDNLTNDEFQYKVENLVRLLDIPINKLIDLLIN